MALAARACLPASGILTLSGRIVQTSTMSRAIRWGATSPRLPSETFLAMTSSRRDSRASHSPLPASAKRTRWVMKTDSGVKAQGTLFFEVAKIMEYHRPKAFLLENVKNLVNHDKGNTFRVIHNTLKKELGYQVHWKVINAQRFVPQSRERIFIAGFREPNSFTFDDLELPEPQDGPLLKTILHPEDGTECPDGHFTMGKKGQVAEKYTLTNHLWDYLQAYAKKHREKGNGFGFGLFGPDDIARTLSARYYKDGSEILIRQEGKNPRRLTPRECSRLMGFDAPGEASFRIPVSDTRAYKQFGNAVVVPVANAVAAHMAPWIIENKPRRFIKKMNSPTV